MDRDGLAIMPEAAPATVFPRAGAAHVPAAVVARPAILRTPAHRADAFRALHTPTFRRYFYGQIASASGTFLLSTALGWLALQLTGSATDLGLVLAAGSLPPLVLGAWGGALVDRMELRRLLMVTQILFGLLAAVLWIAALAGHATITLLVVVSVASGLLSVVDSPARQTFASLLVAPG
jgi:MFS family permease